jgi:capsid portal protein
VACAVAIKGDSLASQHNVKYFDNSATPRYICTLSGGRLSKTAEDKLFKFLQTSLRGNPHRTLFIPLPNDPQGNPIKFEMHRVDDDVHDGSWENYRERNKQDILTAHGVPMSRIGGSDDKGTAQSLSADRMFKEQVVVPNQELFEKMINKVIKEKTDIVRFNLNELSLTDELAQSQIDERYVRNQVMKINEARNKIGQMVISSLSLSHKQQPNKMHRLVALEHGISNVQQTILIVQQLFLDEIRKERVAKSNICVTI